MSNWFARSPLMRYPQVVPERHRGGAVTIGNFDGVHRGHERVLEVLRQSAGDGPAVVVSFYPHPIHVLRGDSSLRYISSVREKAEACGRLGIDLIYLIHFTQAVSQWSALKFIEEVLVKAVGAKVLVVGDDVAIGKGREGNIDFLVATLPRYQIELRIVPRLEINGIKAGSRRIRDLIEAGMVEEAIGLIGGAFTISARVGHGDKRGSVLGFPTANIAVGKRLIPKRGVYACLVALEGKTYKAVANIGVRPTFSGVGERLEVHILDFPNCSLYGSRIHVSFIARLREECRFNSLDDLKKQVSKDIVNARQSLSHV